MSNDYLGRNIKLTRKDAATLIRKAAPASRFYVHLRMDLPIDGEPTKIFQGSGSSYLKLSRSQALKLVSSLFNDTLESRGARVPVNIVEQSSAIRGCISNYWIG